VITDMALCPDPKFSESEDVDFLANNLLTRNTETREMAKRENAENFTYVPKVYGTSSSHGSNNSFGSNNSSAISSDSLASWERVCDKLRQTYGEAIYRSWLSPLEFAGVSGGKAVIYVPTRFMREWVSNHYLETMRRFWQLEGVGVHAIDLMVTPRAAPVRSSANFVGNVSEFSNKTDNFSNKKHEPDANKVRALYGNSSGVDSSLEALEQAGAALDSRFTFDNFVVGKPNELAFAAARRVAESPGVVQGCNPLFLYGGVGLGKTHLMHAIAWHIRGNNPNRRVIYLSAEQFMYQFIRALRFNDTIAFKEQFRSVDVLMVDDVQFISGKDSTQEEFFHTFNALVEQNKQLVISADRSPSDLEGLEERVRSRLGWGLVADINDTSYELRLGILQSKAERLSIPVPQKVLEFLAQKITSNIRELEGALNRVVAHAALIEREINLETTNDVLKDLLRANDRKVTVEDIQKAVAGHYHIKVSDMHSGRRSISVARPRQIAMYLAKQLTSRSLPEIGRKFGGKDHTTVMHAIKRVEELCGKDSEMQEDVSLLSRMLQS